MLKNYLKIALRNLIKQRVYSLINISGLAVGMASVLLIALYIFDELSYDRYHEKADRIYRLTIADIDEDYPGYMGSMAPLAPLLKNNFPEIENFVRFDPFGFKNKILISHGHKSFYEERFFLADPSIFDIFDFNLLSGDPNNILANPTDLIITKSTANKYFGDKDPLGKIINYEGNIEFTVTGVMEDVPENSHFGFDFIGSFTYINEIKKWDALNNWGTWNFYSYVLIKENVDVKEFEIKCTAYISKLMDSTDKKLYLQPLTNIYLRSNISRDVHHRGDILTVYFFSAIALVILMIACINFMNLYTANSERRSKEVGMRKVLGAYKKQIVFQFLGESLFISILALPIALLIVEMVLPQFNQITGKAIVAEYSKNISLLLGLFSLITVVGLISGSYPAFFISSIQPLKIFRSKLNTGRKGYSFRNLLVIFQFAMSIILISSTFIINTQNYFVRNTKLGYDKENIVNIPIYSSETKNNYQTFRSEIISNPNIVDATATSFTPSVERWREGLYFEGMKDTDDHSFFRLSGDFNFIDLFKLDIIAGRTFDRKSPADLGKAFILNETAVREIGWTPDEAIGKKFGRGNVPGNIIGVIKDFHFRSLRQETKPLAINVFPRMFQYISVKIKGIDIQNTISFLDQKWKSVNPGLPFEYYFYDQEFDKLYKIDQRTEKVFRYFTILAIFIACLGLFGLASFMTEQRTKEIGVRKVLGASISSILLLLSKELTKWVILANIIAWPVAWLIMEEWLQNFAYRIDIHWWIFVAAGILALVIAFFTIGSRAMKAAISNPVEALRYE